MTGRWLLPLQGILIREALRFLQQRERFFAALVRPVIWLVIFAAGLRAAMGGNLAGPDGQPIPYELYIAPGLCAMVQLFNGMQSSLSLVYDREMGSMRMLLTTPLPRWYLIFCRLLAGTVVSILQVYAFLIVALLFGVAIPWVGLIAVLPALVLTGLMLGSLGLLLAARIRQLENFAGIMNFVIFPMFFLSPALYPLDGMRASSEALYWLARINPFTHAVDLLRGALHVEVDGAALGFTLIALLAAGGLAMWAYTPARGLRGGGPPGR
ncbi:MAG: multidrug ABC transporter permease [Rhizobiales bacterium NRL2]|nr:MAG: multidrug ABC transporter permease [Rhizobiales bacterium NRL2]